MGVKLAVSAEEIDAVNEVLHNFERELGETAAGKIRLLGILLGVPNPEGSYGVLAVKSNRMNDEEFTNIVRGTGEWMFQKSVQ